MSFIFFTFAEAVPDGAPKAPNFFFSPTGGPKAPKGDAGGAASPEGEGNLAKGGRFASLFENSISFDLEKCASVGICFKTSTIVNSINPHSKSLRLEKASPLF